MRFSCERDSLANAVAIASRALGVKPYGNGVHLKLEADNLIIVGKETDILIEAHLNVVGHQDGSAIVPTPLTQDMIKSLPEGVVDIDSDDTILTLKSGKAKVSVYLVADYSSPFSREEGGETVIVQSAELREALAQVLRASAKNDVRDFIYTGVLFASDDEGLRLVATDGVRMAVRSLETVNLLEGEEGEVLLPAKALAELEKILQSNPQEPLQVTIRKKEASFKIAEVELITRIINEKYRDYKQVIEATYPKKLLINKAELLEALRRLRRMARESREITNLKLNVDHDSVKLSINIRQVGNANEDLSGVFSSEDPIQIIFDPELFYEGVDAVSSQDVAINITEENKPVKISNSDDSDLVYMLMPIRQNKG